MALQEDISLIISASFRGQQAFTDLQNQVRQATTQLDATLGAGLRAINDFKFDTLGASLAGIGTSAEAAAARVRDTLGAELDALDAQLAALDLSRLGGGPGGGSRGGGGGGGGFISSLFGGGGGRTSAPPVTLPANTVTALSALDPALPGIIQQLQAREAAVTELEQTYGISRTVASGALTRLESQGSTAVTAGRLAAAGIAEKAGVPGRLGYASALLGPEALAALGGTYAFYQLAKAGANFQSAGYALAGNTGIGSADLALISQSSLNAGASGLPFDATQLLQGTYAPLSGGVPANVAAGAQKYLAMASAVARQQDVTLLGQAATSLIDVYTKGGGTAATVGDFRTQLEYLTQAEKLGQTPPGTIASIISRFAPTAAAAGLTEPEAFGALSKETLAGATGPQAAQNLSAFLRATILKPTATTTRLAGQYGIDIGPGAIEAAGGLPQYVQEIVSALGNNPELIQQFTAQRNAATFVRQMTQGGGLFGGRTSLTGLIGGVAGAPGANVLEMQYGVTQQGINQQLADVSAKLKTDFTSLGNTLNEQFTPAVLKAASSLLDAAQGLGDKLGALGHGIDLESQALDQFAREHSLRPTVDAAGAAKDAAGSAIGGFFSGLGGAVHGAISAVAGIGGGITTPRIAPAGYIGPLPAGVTRAPFIGPRLTATAPEAQAGPPEPRAVPYDFTGPLLPGEYREAPPASPAFRFGSQFAGRGYGGRSDLTDRQMNGIVEMALRGPLGSGSPSNVPVQDIRGTINAMLASGVNQVTGQPLSAADWDTALRMLQSDLANSKYTTGQRAGIFAQESAKIGKYEVSGPLAAFTAGRGAFLSGQESLSDFMAQAQGAATIYATAPGLSPAARQAGLSRVAQQTATATTVNSAQITLQAAQLFQDSVRIHHGSAQQMVDAANKTYNASLALAKAQADAGLLKGTDLANLKNRALDARGTSFAQAFQQGLVPLQDAITNAQLTNNPAALAAAVKALDAYYTSQGGQGGLSKVEIANAKLQNDQLLSALRVAGPQLIRPSGAGLGSIGEAGFGSAVATLVGGHANAAAQTIALLQQQVRHLQEALNESRQEVYLLRQTSTAVVSIDKKTPHPASHTTTHPRRGAPRPHGARR